MANLLDTLKQLFSGRAVLTTTARVVDADIKQLLDLYESDDFFEYWQGEVAKSGLTTEQRTILQRHFPRGNWLKTIVQRMAYSLPSFDVVFTDEQGEALKDKQQEELQTWLKQRFAQRGWEGDDNFWQAWPFWRELLFLTGRLAVKHLLPENQDLGVVQRLAQLNLDYAVADEDRKKIVEFRTSYLVGGSSFLATQKVGVEVINDKEWTKQVTGGAVETQQVPSDWGFIPVSYVAWEKLEGEPLGNPYGRRVMKKILNILSCLQDVRAANRKNSDPIKVLGNADLPPGTSLQAGATVSLKSRWPGQPVSAQLLGGGLNLQSLFEELKQHLFDLYETAQLPFPGRDQVSVTPTASGKALTILSAPQVQYRQAYLPVEQGFLEDLIWKMAVIDGKKLSRNQVLVQHDQIQPPDAKTVQDDSQFFMDEGFVQESLRRRGVEEDNITKLLKEREEFKAKQADELLLGQGDLLNPGKDTLIDETVKGDGEKA